MWSNSVHVHWTVLNLSTLLLASMLTLLRLECYIGCVPFVKGMKCLSIRTLFFFFGQFTAFLLLLTVKA